LAPQPPPQTSPRPTCAAHRRHHPLTPLCATTSLLHCKQIEGENRNALGYHNYALQSSPLAPTKSSNLIALVSHPLLSP
jgi:hypothetical protein